MGILNAGNTENTELINSLCSLCSLCSLWLMSYFHKVLTVMSLFCRFCGGLGGGHCTRFVKEELVDASFTIQQNINNAIVTGIDCGKGIAFARHPFKATQADLYAVDNCFQLAQGHLFQ